MDLLFLIYLLFQTSQGLFIPLLLESKKSANQKQLTEKTQMSTARYALLIFMTLVSLGNLCDGQTVKVDVNDSSDVSARMDKIFSRWDKPNSPGVAVAVVRDGQIVFKKGYGMANLEYDVPVTPSTVFHIASVSKQFTTFAVILLANQGKLSLDDDIRKHIPEVPDFGHKITLRHLAHHTSGMRDQWALLQMAGWRMDDVITKNHIMKLVAKQQDLNFEPGKRFLYCNTGFTLLAEVVARVSGQSFAEFTKANIFEPLEMGNTLFYDDHEKIVPNRAYSYRPSSNGFRKSVLNYANVGATSLFTTAEDLALWTNNFENPKVGNRELIDQMNTPGELNDGTATSYGLGQFIGKYRGLDQIGHSGADAGYRSDLKRFPNQKVSILVLSNDGSANASTLTNRVANIFLRKEIDAVKKEIKKTAKPEGNKKASKAKAANVSIDPLQLKEFEGSYRVVPGVVLSIGLEEGKLHVKATGQKKEPLAALSPTRFVAEQIGAQIDFIVADDKSVSELKLRFGGQSYKCARVEPFDKANVDLTEFTGTYYSPELSTNYRFVIKDEKLVIQHTRNEDFRAQPIDVDLFASGPVLGQIKFVRDQDDNVVGCTMSNSRVLNLRFEKVQE